MEIIISALIILTLITLFLVQGSRPFLKIAYSDALEKAGLTEDDLSLVSPHIVQEWKDRGVSPHEMACVYSEFRHLKRTY